MSTTNDKPGSNLDPMSLEAIEDQLKQFEIEERKRLGLPIESVDITPDSATTTALGETRKFSAVARDARGAVVPGVAFTWSSSTSTVATIDTSGLATGLASGTATITVSSGGVSDSATLRVTQVVASVVVCCIAL